MSQVKWNYIENKRINEVVDCSFVHDFWWILLFSKTLPQKKTLCQINVKK